MTVQTTVFTRFTVLIGFMERTFCYTSAKPTNKPSPNELVRKNGTFWEYNEGKVEIRLGRLVGEQTPSDKQWENQIDLAEVLLINAHKPAQNASNIGELSQLRDKDLRNVHVLNWGDFGALLPEVSGDRWTDKWVSDKFDVYGSHR